MAGVEIAGCGTPHPAVELSASRPQDRCFAEFGSKAGVSACVQEFATRFFQLRPAVTPRGFTAAASFHPTKPFRLQPALQPPPARRRVENAAEAKNSRPQAYCRAITIVTPD